MHNSPFSGYQKVWRSTVTVLVVQGNRSEGQEETPCNRTHQPRQKHSRRGQAFASGLVLGAIAAGGMARWFLESNSRRVAQRDIFSWPDMVKAGRK
jgi:hypothetical protein